MKCWHGCEGAAVNVQIGDGVAVPVCIRHYVADGYPGAPHRIVKVFDKDQWEAWRRGEEAKTAAKTAIGGG